MGSDRDDLLERLTVERFGTHRHIAAERSKDYEHPSVTTRRVALLAAEVDGHGEED